MKKKRENSGMTSEDVGLARAVASHCIKRTRLNGREDELTQRQIKRTNNIVSRIIRK